MVLYKFSKVDILSTIYYKTMSKDVPMRARYPSRLTPRKCLVRILFPLEGPHGFFGPPFLGSRGAYQLLVPLQVLPRDTGPKIRFQLSMVCITGQVADFYLGSEPLSGNTRYHREFSSSCNKGGNCQVTKLLIFLRHWGKGLVSMICKIGRPDSICSRL